MLGLPLDGEQLLLLRGLPARHKCWACEAPAGTLAHGSICTTHGNQSSRRSCNVFDDCMDFLARGPICIRTDRSDVLSLWCTQTRPGDAHTTVLPEMKTWRDRAHVECAPKRERIDKPVRAKETVSPQSAVVDADWPLPARAMGLRCHCNNAEGERSGQCRLHRA